MVEELEEFLDTGFKRGELKSIFFPENPVICRSCLKPRINKKLNAFIYPNKNKKKYARSESFMDHIISSE